MKKYEVHLDVDGSDPVIVVADYIDIGTGVGGNYPPGTLLMFNDGSAWPVAAFAADKWEHVREIADER